MAGQYYPLYVTNLFQISEKYLEPAPKLQQVTGRVKRKKLTPVQKEIQKTELRLKSLKELEKLQSDNAEYKKKVKENNQCIKELKEKVGM